MGFVDSALLEGTLYLRKGQEAFKHYIQVYIERKINFNYYIKAMPVFMIFCFIAIILQTRRMFVLFCRPVYIVLCYY